MKTPMDYELEYMECLFDSIKSKRTESYVIHRIWNKLDDDRVRFVTQQKITLPNGKYALADLYLPQLNIFVEVNEPYHDKQKAQDKYRNETIVELTEAHQFIIECGKGTDKCEWKSLSEIHQQIDECVTFIKKRITDVGDQLKPWSMSESLTVEFHKNKGYLNVDDNDALRTIDDICRLTGGVKRDRGFLRAGTAELPQHPDMELWFPSQTQRTRKRTSIILRTLSRRIFNVSRSLSSKTTLVLRTTSSLAFSALMLKQAAKTRNAFGEESVLNINCNVVRFKTTRLRHSP